MPHRRNSGSKARHHKLGFNKTGFQRKRERLEARRQLADFPRLMAG